MSDIRRPCDNGRCILCLDEIKSTEAGIAITVPSKKLSKIKNKSKFIFQWNLHLPSNYMHKKCWENANIISAPESKIVDSVRGTVEYFDNVDQMQMAVAATVQLLLESKSTVAFTGSGISASSGIPTYRGAAGIDNVADHGATVVDLTAGGEDVDEVDYSRLQPTPTHISLTRLNGLGLLSYCITQNCDNLHQKSGLDSVYISDLHGNVFVEYCEKCFSVYERDFAVDEYSTDCKNEPWYVRCATCGWNHYTGRKCDTGNCRGRLKDTIVNFGDDLHEFICGGLRKATMKCRHADVCLCLGTSLSIFPASSLPLKAKDRVIVNLQETDMDDDCTVRVWGTTDNFFALLMPAIEHALQEKKNLATGKRKRILAVADDTHK